MNPIRWLAALGLLLTIAALSRADDRTLPRLMNDNAHLPVPDPTNPDQTKADLAAAASLTKSNLVLRFQNVALSEALAFFGDVTKTRFVVDYAALKNAGIDPSVAIDLPAQHVTMERGLSTILVLGAAGGTARLDFEIRDGTVFISTADELNKTTVTRVFDVSDLAQDQQANLVDLIEKSVLQDTWRQNGGTVGYLQLFKGKLIVVQTSLGQRQVANFLSRLRHPNPNAPGNSP